MGRVLNKDDLQKFLDDLNEEYVVLGSTKKGGATSTYSYPSFNPVKNSDNLNLQYNTAMFSPKEILFPDSESLYRYRKENGDVEIQDQGEVWDKKRILMGIHPCDINAISKLDKVLLEEEFEEPFYKERRNNLIIIGMTCSEPGENCFCNILASGPDVESNYNLLMTDIGESYFFKIGNSLGEDLVDKEYFREHSEEERELREEAINKVRKELPEDMDIDAISGKMEDSYNAELWDELSDRCVSCGNCNMVCPTCHCFTIKEKINENRDEGERVRIWDSCHFARFAEMAGGLNVREKTSSRFKHRLYDKFYYDSRRFDSVFCIGCGRCIEFCPSNLDILDTLRRVQEEVE